MPRMISGIMMGTVESPSSAPLPKNVRPAIPTAPMVPKMAARPLDSTASFKLLKKALMMVWLWNSFWYQLKVNPAQWNSLVSLKE